jgi:putative transcriptional regulator
MRPRLRPIFAAAFERQCPDVALRAHPGYGSSTGGSAHRETRRQNLSKENTIVARQKSDGALVEVLPDGTTRPLHDRTDWSRVDAMTEEDVHTAAMADPDAQPTTPEEMATARRVPRVRTIRRALGLTQEDFAARYQIPLGTLRDWEQGRTEPDQPARAYLKVIASDPEGVWRSLKQVPAPAR